MTLPVDPRPRLRAIAATPGQIGLAALILGFLALFLAVPVLTVLYVAFTERATGAFTLVNFYDFVRTDLFIESFWNSTVTVQQVAPFREDALSWLVWYFHKTGVKAVTFSTV